MSDKYFWPCYYAPGPCGSSTWICSRVPLSEEKTKIWLKARELEHEADPSACKGKFLTRWAAYQGFLDYFFANKDVPKPRVWTKL